MAGRGLNSFRRGINKPNRPPIRPIGSPGFRLGGKSRSVGSPGFCLIGKSRSDGFRAIRENIGGFGARLTHPSGVRSDGWADVPGVLAPAHFPDASGVAIRSAGWKHLASPGDLIESGCPGGTSEISRVVSGVGGCLVLDSQNPRTRCRFLAIRNFHRRRLTLFCHGMSLFRHGIG